MVAGAMLHIYVVAGAMLQQLPGQLRKAEIESAKRAREVAALTAEARRLSEMVGPLQERANPNPSPSPNPNPNPRDVHTVQYLAAPHRGDQTHD